MTTQKIPVVLASQSPRRQDVLRELGIPFGVFSPQILEEFTGKAGAAKIASNLAKKKALKYPQKGRLVIAMDTIVTISRRKLGKPSDRKDAEWMLRLLSDQTHRVVTGVALRYGSRLVSDAEITRVRFRRITPKEMKWYLDSGEPYDKAGAYAIQGLGRIFVDRIEGCFYNVVGFPIGCFQRLLRRLGLSILDLIP